MSGSTIDYDVNNYSVGELRKIVGVSEEDSVDEMKSKVKKFKDQSPTKTVLEFFTQLEQRLFKEKYFQRMEYASDDDDSVEDVVVNNTQTNYDLIQNKTIISGGSMPVQKEKFIPTNFTSEYAYPNGVLNPLEKRSFTKIINIDTALRDNYLSTSSNKVNWTLAQPENNVVSMKLASFELPVMWYDISETNKNNTFGVKLYNMTKYQDVSHVITVPSGNYNHSEMMDTINTIFKNTKQGLEYLTFEISTVTTKSSMRAIHVTDSTFDSTLVSPYDSTSNEYSPDFYYEIDFYTGVDGTRVACGDELDFRKTLGWYIGFRKATYTVRKTDTFLNLLSEVEPNVLYEAYFSSESSYGSGRTNYVYICVNDYNKNCLTETISSYSGSVFVGKNILGRISVDVPSQEIMINNANDRIFKQRDFLGPVTMRKFSIEILDKFGKLIDLNNNDFSLSLEMTILY